MFSDISSGILSGISVDISSGISSDISCGILSDMTYLTYLGTFPLAFPAFFLAFLLTFFWLFRAGPNETEPAAKVQSKVQRQQQNPKQSAKSKAKNLFGSGLLSIDSRSRSFSHSDQSRLSAWFFRGVRCGQWIKAGAMSGSVTTRSWGSMKDLNGHIPFGFFPGPVRGWPNYLTIWLSDLTRLSIYRNLSILSNLFNLLFIITRHYHYWYWWLMINDY